MTELQNEADFFNEIAPKIRKRVLDFKGRASVHVEKAVGDYATEVDIAVENLIVDEINKRFPGDMILAEEGHSDTQIPDGRIWIIDPICGTTNLARGAKVFSSNIALADKGILIASCVVDHSQDDYFWSVGQGRVYINDQLFQYIQRPKSFGTVIDIDLGSLGKTTMELKDRYSNATHTLLSKTDYTLVSYNSSLGFAYAGIGKFDGFINVANHPWDVCAAIFLLTQSGGVVSDIDGNNWTIASTSAIGARNANVHQTLINALSYK